MPKVIYDTRHSVTIAATGTSFTDTLDSDLRCRGKLVEIIITTPNMTNAVTTTPSIVRATSSATAWTDTAIPENTTISLQVDPPVHVSESDTFTFTLSGAAGAGGGTLYFTPIIEADD